MNRRNPRLILSKLAVLTVIAVTGSLLATLRPADAALLGPTLDSVSPSQVYPGVVNKKLVLNGDFTSGDAQVSFSPNTGITIVGSPKTVSTSEIDVNITVATDAPNTARDVTVTQGLLGGSSTCSKCLTIAPDVTNAVGLNGVLSNGAPNGVIKVDGHGFKPGAVVRIERKNYGFNAAETASVNGTNVQVTPGTAQNGNASSLTATVATDIQPAGHWKVSVVNPDNNVATFGDGDTTGLLIAGGEPTLKSITSPSTPRINSGQELQFTLTGDNFAKGLTVTVSGGGVTQSAVAVVTSKSLAQVNLRASSSPGPSGPRTLVLRNADGQSSSNADAIWVNQDPTPVGTPTIGSVTPSKLGLGADKVKVIVTGTNFGPTPAVTVNPASKVTVDATRNSSTQLTLAVSVASDAATGLRDLIVTNTGGASATKSEALDITNAFNVTTINPPGRPRGYEGTFQINGAGFTGSPSVTVSGSGVTVGAVTVNSPALMTANVTVANDAPLSARDVTVTLNGTPKVCTGCFTVSKVPTLTSVSPTTGNGGGQVNVTATGTDFADNPSLVLERSGQNPINGILVNRVSASQVTGTFDLTNAAPGTWDVRVVNADGGATAPSANSKFTVALGAPTVDSSDPDFVSQNDPSTKLHITGSRFAAGMTVTIPNAGGVTVKEVNRLSNTAADVTVATSDGARLGARDITVTNTDGQSGTCPSCFVVTQGQQAKNFGPGVTAFENFTGGAFVGAGNIDGTTTNGNEFVVGANAGGGPHVKPYRINPVTGAIQELGPGWFAYPGGFAGGVHVAVGNVDGNAANGQEIITGAGPGGGPHVRVWHLNNDLSASELGGFFAYGANFDGGVWVATGDVDGDGRDEIITGAGPGGGPHVRIWKFNNGNFTEVSGFFAYAPGFAGGVAVGAGNVIAEDPEANQRDEVVVVPAQGGGPHLKVLNTAGATLREFFAFETSDENGYRIAVGDFDFDTVDDVAVGRGSDGEMLIAQITDTGFNKLVNPNPRPFGNLPIGTNVAAVDADVDGDADLVLTPDHNHEVTVRIQRPTSLT